MSPSEIVRVGRSVTLWNIVLIFGAAITALATLLSIRYNDKLQGLKDGELSRFQADAQRDISQANERAAAANSTAKAAEESTAIALVRQKELEKSNIELAITLEKEHQSRLKLEASIAPRRLTAEQRELLRQSLSPFGGNGIAITRLGDQEALGLADDIIGALRAAGWQLRVENVGMVAPPVYGLALSVPEHLHKHPAVAALIKAFHDARLHVAVHTAGGQDVHLTIGLKPVTSP